MKISGTSPCGVLLIRFFSRCHKSHYFILQSGWCWWKKLNVQSVNSSSSWLPSLISSSVSSLITLWSEKLGGEFSVNLNTAGNLVRSTAENGGDHHHHSCCDDRNSNCHPSYYHDQHHPGYEGFEDVSDSRGCFHCVLDSIHSDGNMVRVHR